jgi:hypothetical protein
MQQITNLRYGAVRAAAVKAYPPEEDGVRTATEAVCE